MHNIMYNSYVIYLHKICFINIYKIDVHSVNMTRIELKHAGVVIF